MIPLLLKMLDVVIKEKPVYEPVFVRDFLRVDRKLRYKYLQDLKNGLTTSTVLATFTVGGNIGNYHFIWRIPDNFDVQAALSENDKMIQFVKTQIPHYHSRAMSQDFINMYGRLTSTTSPYVLRDIYKGLTNDQSASRTTDEKEIDKCIKEALESEDPDYCGFT